MQSCGVVEQKNTWVGILVPEESVRRCVTTTEKMMNWMEVVGVFGNDAISRGLGKRAEQLHMDTLL
jgi:hypothetical protein